MRRFLLSVILFAGLISPAFAQYNSLTAYRVRRGAAVPATCDPNRGEVFYVTTLATRGLYHCVGTNTWTRTISGTAIAGMNAYGITETGSTTGLAVTRTDAGHVHLVLTNTAGTADFGVGAAGEAHIDVQAGAEINMRIATADQWVFDTNGMLRSVGMNQAALGALAPANGTFVYCSDCTLASPCAGGGTGALAKRLNGAWVCN